MRMDSSVKTVRTHRVGSVTTGATMVVFGVLFVLRTMFNIVSYSHIFSLWPLILIGLGVELLLSNFGEKKIVYDKGAIVILILMTIFAIGLAVTDVCIEASEVYFANYKM